MGEVRQVVAIAWYRPEDYARVYALAPDGGGMEKTYEEWKEVADDTIVKLAIEGLHVERVVVEPDKFANWPKARRLKSTGVNRARYATVLARRLERDRSRS